MALPEFLADGYLPAGLHLCDESELLQRFGSDNLCRRRLGIRVQTWLALARAIRAKRFLIDGSFVTAKEEPNDVDAVIWLPDNFHDRVAFREEPATMIEQMLVTQYPEELFPAYDADDWQEWVETFSRIRESVEHQKEIVEMRL